MLYTSYQKKSPQSQGEKHEKIYSYPGCSSHPAGLFVHLPAFYAAGRLRPPAGRYRHLHFPAAHSLFALLLRQARVALTTIEITRKTKERITQIGSFVQTQPDAVTQGLVTPEGPGIV